MPDRRLFDSSALVAPPEPRVEVQTTTREATPEEKVEARREASARFYDAFFRAHPMRPMGHS